MTHFLPFRRGAAALLPLLLGATGAFAQATLGNSPYSETFDNLATGLPAGFSVRTGATAALGADAGLKATDPTSWGTTSGGFYNYASGTGLMADAAPADQAAAANRALGLRQTSSFGNPGGAFVFEVDNTKSKTGFQLTFKLQSLDVASPRITTWQVDYGVGETPTTFTAVGSAATTGDLTFGSKDVTVDFGSQLDNLPGPVWIRVVTLTASGTSSSGAGGNRPTSAIDDFSLSWNTTAPDAPAITVAPTSLDFPAQTINTNSAAQTYTLAAANLTAPVAVAATGPFTISKDGTTFATSLDYTAAELATAQTVAVRFVPTAGGAATGSITHTSAGAVTQTVALTGAGLDPNNLVFSFDNCTTALSDGWSQFSVAGAQTWACTAFGHDGTDEAGKKSSPNGVQINGYVTGTGNVANEDWFISPAFDTREFTYPLFSFWSRVAFNGPPLQLRVSTNYSGTGSPAAAGVTWTDLDVVFPAPGSDTWTKTSNVDLSAYKGQQVYVAFVYLSTPDEAARWTLDDISLLNSATAPAPVLATATKSLDFGYQAVNTAATQTFAVTLRNLTAPATITAAGGGFTVSKDGTTFSSSVSYSVAESVDNQAKMLTVRFAPTQVQQNYSNTLTLATPGATPVTVALSGNTYNTDNTLEVVNWNLEWFGSPDFGPTDDDQQFANVQTILNSLKADIYGLVEVVDTARLGTIVRQLPGGGYAYRVSDFGSYADNAQDPDYAGDQKLAFVYKKSLFTNVVISDLFRCTQAENCPGYSPWASGRFPYLLDADVTLNGATQHFTFVLIHAKANTSPTATSYARRKAAADQLKAELDANYQGKNVIVLGDFNDDLDQTITAGITPPVTSYNAFTDDVADYTALTLPLSLAGKRSTVSYNDMIDHVLVTNATVADYVPNSAAVLTGVANLVTNYGNTTTDHYPVQTRYTFGVTTPTRAATAANATFDVYPNPASSSLRLALPQAGKALRLVVSGVDGRRVLTATGSLEQVNQQLNQRLGHLAAGVYVLQVVSDQQTYTKRFIKQ